MTDNRNFGEQHDADREAAEGDGSGTNEIRPIKDHLTVDHVPGHGPTGGDGRPDAFVPSDQTAAGALTPPGAQHPGEPAGIPGEAGNLLDPFNVNGSIHNQELLAAGVSAGAVENPKALEDPNLEKKDDKDKGDVQHK